MKRKARRTKSGRRRSTIRATKTAAPKIKYRTRTKTRVRYYSKPTRKPRVKYRKGISARTRQARTARVVAAAVASAGIGAMLGSVANEAGLLNRAPTQNYVGLSASGLVGAGMVVLGMFFKSEGLKLLFYGLGGGLLVEELTRQIDMRFYDFRVAFAGAPALDYSQGISGAQMQLAEQTASPQLPDSSTSSSPPKASSSPSQPTTPSIRQSLTPNQKQALNTIKEGDIETWRFWTLNDPSGKPSEGLRQVFQDKGMLKEGQGLPLEPQTIAMIDSLTNADIDNIKDILKAGGTFVNAIEVRLRNKGTLGPVESLGQLYSYFRE